MKPRRGAAAGGTLLAAVAVATLALAMARKPAPLKLISFQPGFLELPEAAVTQSVPEYDLPANRIVFRQREVRLVVHLGTDFTDRVARINGLLNPDIQVAQGAELTVTVVNLGTISAATLPIDDQPPPYSYPGFIRAVQDGLGVRWGQSRNIEGVKSPVLPQRGGPRRDDPHRVYDVVVQYRAVAPGTVYYRDFANAVQGLWGRIIVVP